MRGLRYGVAAVVLLLLSAVSYPGADLVAFAARARLSQPPAAAAPAGALPWLHVEHPAGGTSYIADEKGRRVILRGAAVAGLVDLYSGTSVSTTPPAPRFPIDPAAYEGGRCPANTDQIKFPPVCENDFPEMARLGFNVVRLGLSWSLLEPKPGEYSRLYLDRVAQVVGWARQNRIYVLLEMHEDGYSRYIPNPEKVALPGGNQAPINDHDGAPAWAVYTDGLPSERFINTREMNPAVFEAFSSFWFNRSGLQDHFIGALAQVARRFVDDSTVMGYDVYNEPWPGWIGPPLFDDLFLLPFYRRVIDAVSGAGDGLPCPAFAGALPVCGYPDLGIHDRRHIYVLEAGHLRSQVDFQTNGWLPASSYPNVAYSIHAYTYKFTLDGVLQMPFLAPPGGYEQSYADAEWEARSMGGALFVTEFGNEPAKDDSQLTNQLLEQEKHLTGSTYWAWKENCDFKTPPWGVYQGIVDDSAGTADWTWRCAYNLGSSRPETRQNGCLRQDKERLLGRVYPTAISGRDPSYHYNPDTGAFQLTATGAKGAAETLVYIPPEVRGAASAGGRATLAGTDERPDGSRVLHVQPEGGAYSVSVAAAPLRLAGCA